MNTLYLPPFSPLLDLAGSFRNGKHTLTLTSMQKCLKISALINLWAKIWKGLKLTPAYDVHVCLPDDYLSVFQWAPSTDKMLLEEETVVYRSDLDNHTVAKIIFLMCFYHVKLKNLENVARRIFLKQVFNLDPVLYA